MLRQTLQSALGGNSTVATPAAPAGAQLPRRGRAASLAPSLSPNLDIQEILLPQARLLVAENLALAGRPPAVRLRLRSTPGLRPARP